MSFISYNQHTSIINFNTAGAKLELAMSFLLAAEMILLRVSPGNVPRPKFCELLLQCRKEHDLLYKHVTAWYFFTSMWYSNDTAVIEHVEKCRDIFVFALAHSRPTQDSPHMESERCQDSTYETPAQPHPLDAYLFLTQGAHEAPPQSHTLEAYLFPAQANQPQGQDDHSIRETQPQTRVRQGRAGTQAESGTPRIAVSGSARIHTLNIQFGNDNYGPMVQRLKPSEGSNRCTGA
ncbi:hypothetical protein CONPUDRAFT_71421 [Coniophora puteana RWD-64-598 SS2]|uniref:Uncharacterized protein n=1 Tax=Coniophora puteana (strain RWD-64-598) TaxID=741705 RepID=A0A5M3MU38_CONPW|nr:uncharacterized protein CONPUDRAFT_71421 [Coniophora puteana RWD-64-598 SS2]EIW82682.1 hypothetical protein CONPUDRAFT_71421 [Coniophora puteana RWD-64-598 SS2]